MDIRKLSVGLIALTLIAGAGALALGQPEHAKKPAGQSQPKAEDDETDEEEITLDKAPEPVRNAATKLAADAKNITKVVKEEDDDLVTYEIEYNEGATRCSAVFSSAGDLMETEKATTEAKLPPAVTAALKKEYPKGTFTEPQAVTRMFYEVTVVIDGKKHEVKVDAAGDIDDDSDEGDGHDEHAGSEEHEKDEKHERKKD